jgi:hypothetical protein
MKNFLLLAATGALLSTGAMAQTTPKAPPPVAAAPPATGAPASKETVRQQMMTDMQKAGFTDVRVRPDSFLVQAKDNNGTPVTMLVDPDSITEIVTAAGMPAGSSGGVTAGEFTTVPAGDMLSSKVVGTDVHNNANQDIGTIKDVAYAGDNVKAYILGVGGFLGMGDHYVAVSPSAITIGYDANAKTWHATMNATADQLKAAPEFKYPT